MIINHNLNAMNAHRQLGMNTVNAGKSMEKLSSGLRINRAGDDAAGLAISEKMRAQIRGLDQASRNAQDGISLIQTAEGALNETHSILQRMRELAVQASNDTSTIEDRRAIQKELNQLIDEVDRIAEKTQFNTQSLLDGTFANKTIHIGANKDENIQLTINAMNSGSLGTKAGSYTASITGLDVTSLDFSSSNATVTIGSVSVTLDQDYSNNIEGLAKTLNDVFSKTVGVSVEAKNNDIIFTSKNSFTSVTIDDDDTNKYLGGDATINETAGATTGSTINTLKVATPETAVAGGVLTQADANKAIEWINNAIETVSAERANLGAFQNRLEHTINNLGTSSENLTAAESRIRDVDMAKEMMAFSKNNILAQAAQAMLAQANQQPQGVLQLLR